MKNVMEHMRMYFILLFVAYVAYGCTTQVEIPTEVLPQPKKSGIIFLGHTYDWQSKGTKVDPLVEEMDLSLYEGIWLGGDVCSASARERSTVIYIDSLFDVSNPNHHWAMGNHDLRNGNWDFITDATQRPTFYTHHHNGMTVMVLNTHLNPLTYCELLDRQYEMFENVVDTISSSSHLVILMHYIIWGGVDPKMKTNDHANGVLPGWDSRCTDSVKSEFKHLLYPALVEVQNRGVQVICISGDMGMKSKSYQFLSNEGLWFLGAGFNNTQERDPEKRKLLPPDQVLYLEHDPVNRSLNWEFRNVNMMPKRRDR